MKKSPTWWKGVSDDHYIVQKAHYIGDSGSSQDTLVADSMAGDGSIVAPMVVTSLVLPPSDSVTSALTAAPLVASLLDVAAVPSSDGAQVFL